MKAGTGVAQDKAKLTRAHAAKADGTAKFRQGQYAQARARFEDAHGLLAKALGPDAPETLEALSDAAAACAALGEHAAARAAHGVVLAARRRTLGAADPSIGTSLHNLGTVFRAQGELAAAEAHHRESLLIWQTSLGATHPVLAKSLGALAQIAQARGDARTALLYAEQSLAIRRQNHAATDPQLAAAFDDLARAHSLAGDDVSASAAWRSALDVLRQNFGTDTPRAAPVLNNLGVASRSLGELEAARDWFAAAVAAAPELAIARHHLAACLSRLGEHAAAKAQRRLALAQQSVFVQQATRVERARVLIPSVSDDGNVPLEHLLPGADFTRIWWFLGEGQPPALPAFDVVFNGVGDPDRAGGGEAALQAFLRSCAQPVLNRPDRIALTRRDRLPNVLGGIEGLATPPACRVEHGQDAALCAMQAGVTAPFLLRPAGSHGGAGLRLMDAFEGLDFSASAAWYLSSFVDFRSADGFYRKYRMAFVDRRPFPYHLAISRDWLVHYFSADMPAHGWKLAEEAAFLSDPRRTLGATAYNAIVSVGSRLDLDFCGIDFTVLHDGRALVFEANATMLIHPERKDGPLAFKNTFIRQITEALDFLVLNKEE
jgi:tetratricopeptide (TPR) repeat protein